MLNIRKNKNKVIAVLMLMIFSFLVLASPVLAIEDETKEIPDYAVNMTIEESLKTGLKLKVSEERKLTVTFEPEEVKNKEILWSTSDRTIVDIKTKTEGDETDSYIVAVAKGNATVKAEYKKEDGSKITDTFSVEVLNADEKIAVEAISSDDIQMYTTEAKKEINSFSLEPDNAEYKNISVTSNDETIAKIEKETDIETGEDNYNIIGLKEGNVTITVTVTNDDNTKVTNSFNAEIIEYTPVTLIEAEDMTVYKDDKEVLFNPDYTVLPEEQTDEEDNVVIKGATIPDIEISSDNEEVVALNEVEDEEEQIKDEEGNAENFKALKALKTGVANITLTSVDNPDISKVIKVTVKDFVSVGNIIITGDENFKDNTLTLIEGATGLLSEENENEDASEEQNEWESSNPDIATVDSNTGEVTAIKEGTCTITCSNVYEPEIKSSVTVKVEPFIHTNSVILDKTNIELYEGENEEIKAIVSPDDAMNKEVIWQSSDESIATIDDDGNIRAVGEGECEIIALSDDNEDVKAVCNLKVKKYVNVESIDVDTLDVDLTIGETKKVNAMINPLNSHNPTINFISADEDIAIVDDVGNVTGLKKGVTTIKAVSEDNKDIFKAINVYVTEKKVVINTPIKEIKFVSSFSDMTVSEEKKLDVDIIPLNADYKTLKWESSNTLVADVLADGTVRANGEGSCTIMATSQDGSNIKVDTTINVKKIDVEKIDLNDNEITLKKKEIKELSANIIPDKASFKNILWTSSDKSVAVVEEKQGKITVTGKDIGECEIYAISLDNKEIKAVCKITCVFDEENK